MFVAGNFITALVGVLGMVLELYMWIVIVSALISWVNPDPYNPVVRFLRQATEPVLGRVRRYLPSMGGLDLSPIVVILAIVFLKQFLVGSLMELARRMR